MVLVADLYGPVEPTVFIPFPSALKAITPRNTLILPGELSKHAISEGTKSVTKVRFFFDHRSSIALKAHGFLPLCLVVLERGCEVNWLVCYLSFATTWRGVFEPCRAETFVFADFVSFVFDWVVLYRCIVLRYLSIYSLIHSTSVRLTVSVWALCDQSPNNCV